MDLLGDFGEETGDQKTACGAGMRGAEARQTAAVLLARLRSPHAATINSGQGPIMQIMNVRQFHGASWRLRAAAGVLGLALLAVRVSGQARPVTAGFHIERLSPASYRILPRHARLVRVGTGFNWTEGPVWTPEGFLLFADIRNNRIMKWRPGHGFSIFMHPSGYLGAGKYPGPESGSNGMTVDPRGRLTVAGHAQRDVWRLESYGAGARRTILADRYQGRRLNSPNDLVYGPHGALYFTDPPYGLPMQNDRDPRKQLKVNGVYRILNAVRQRPGSPPNPRNLQLLIANLSRPNGIAFSPRQHYLYVDNTAPQELWMRYLVRSDGSLGRGRVFYNATGHSGPGAPDGMKVNRAGDIFSAGPGGLWIFSPQGKPLAIVHLPEVMANCAWGGGDRRTLYITADTSLYRLRMNIPGLKP